MDTNELTYWVAVAIEQDAHLNLRGESEDEVIALMANEAMHTDVEYAPPKEVTITFSGALHLLDMCMEERAGWEGNYE